MEDQRPEIDPPPSKRRGLPDEPHRARVALGLLTVVVTAVFSYIAFSNINLSVAWRGLKATDYWWLLAALGAWALGNVARSLRWRALFARERRPSVGAVSNAMMVGYLYNNIMPARAGEAARVLVLTRRSAASATEIVGTVVLERLYDVLGILIIFFAAGPWLPRVSWIGTAAGAAIVLIALIVLASLVLAIFEDRPLLWLLRPLQRIPRFSRERFEQTVSELIHGLSGLRHRGSALQALLWTLAAWALTALCAYLVSLALHLHLPASCGVLVAVAVGLSMILPSPPAAVGVFEGAALIALKPYAVPHSSALPYALVLHLVNFVPFVIAGVYLLHHNARHPAAPT